MKRILIINGHPDRESYNHSLSQAYMEGAGDKNASVERINIGDLKFDPNLKYGYRKRMDLEPDLFDAIEKIKKADHLVWFFPVWWYGSPAIMKGFIDRVFLPGIAYEPIEGKLQLRKLFKGKTARLIVTADTPGWYDYLFMKRPAIMQFKKGTLELCGIRPVKVTYIAPMKDSKALFREKWLRRVKALGQNLA